MSEHLIGLPTLIRSVSIMHVCVKAYGCFGIFFFFLRHFHFMWVVLQSSLSMSFSSVFSHGLPSICVISFLECFSHLDLHLCLGYFLLTFSSKPPLGFSLCSFLKHVDYVFSKVSPSPHFCM
jgi:hypothetical protein